jgi:hypothetical protein
MEGVHVVPSAANRTGVSCDPIGDLLRVLGLPDVSWARSLLGKPQLASLLKRP